MAALLLQIVAWAWMAPAVAATGGPAAAAGIPVCTPDGLRTLTPDGTPLPEDLPADRPAGAADHGCPLCPLVGGLSLPPPAATALPGAAAPRYTGPPPGAPVAPAGVRSSRKARAPPGGL